MQGCKGRIPARITGNLMKQYLNMGSFEKPASFIKLKLNKKLVKKKQTISESITEFFKQP
jgi:hypothetical protein